MIMALLIVHKNINITLVILQNQTFSDMWLYTYSSVLEKTLFSMNEGTQPSKYICD